MPLPIEKKYTAEEFYSMNLSVPGELINGEIFDMSPSPDIRHQRISLKITNVISNYISKNNGKCEVFNAPTDVRLNEDTVVVPDIFVACNPDNFDEQKYNGAPDWIIEIVSPGSTSRDYRDKLLLYKNAGVKEYWIIDPLADKVIVYLFGKPDMAAFYSFDDKITAGLYRENSEPLVICVNETLK